MVCRLSVTLEQGHCYICYTGPELSVTFQTNIVTLYKGRRQMLDWEMVLRFERRNCLSGHLQSFFFLSEGEKERVRGKRQKEMHFSSTLRERRGHFWF